MEYELGFCRPEELPELTELTNRIFRAGGDGDMGREYPLVFGPENSGNLMVARCGGRIVAHVGVCLRDACILGAKLRVASIGAVGTDPEHRGRRLAGRLMDQARLHGIRDGASLMLISGGRGLYHRLGYVQVGLFHQYTVPAGEAGTRFQVHALQDTDLSAVVRLHQTEPTRFFRTREDWRKLLSAGMLMNQPADLLLVEQHGVPVAYAGVQRPKAAAGTPVSVVRVREVAGSRAALAEVLPSLARRYDAELADVIFQAEDAEWRGQAAQRSWTPTSAAFPGTLGIFDPVCFLDAIRPLVAERTGSELQLQPHGAGARLSVGDHSLDLETMGLLTALVFGGETEEARRLPALPAAVKEAVDAAFPLPLLWYGYNYV